MKNLTYKIILILFVLSYASAFAADDAHGEPEAPAKSGEEVAKQCVSCHGEDGNSIAPNFPRIAGQHADYMFHALKSYKNGDRKNAIMAGIVTALSEKEMKNVSAYYANMSGGLSVVDFENESMR